MSSRDLGFSVEARAEAFLEAQGLTTIDRNYSCRFGEVDLIMRDGEALVFVEVRGRSSERFGKAIESVTVQKQRRIIATAAHYLQRQPGSANKPCRFDVVGVLTCIEPPSIEWIRSAFDA